jgi:hypothetical protein
MCNIGAHVRTEGVVIQRAISFVCRQHNVITIFIYPTELTVYMFIGLCGNRFIELGAVPKCIFCEMFSDICMGHTNLPIFGSHL